MKLKIIPERYWDTEDKMAARLRVYKLLAPMSPGPLQLMPGGTLLETEVAIEFFPLHMHRVVEINPAAQADFTRAVVKRYGKKPKELGIQQRRMWLSEASWRMSAEDEKVTAANLDFTGNLDSFHSGSVFSELDGWCASCVMPRGRVAVWILSGREQRIKFAKRGAADLTPEEANDRRLKTLLHRLNVGLTRSAKPRLATLVDKGQYHNDNSNNTMLWAVFEITPKTERN